MNRVGFANPIRFVNLKLSVFMKWVDYAKMILQALLAFLGALGGSAI